MDAREVLAKRSGPRAVVAIALLAIAGCASVAPPARGWLEVRSTNFSLYTTLAEPDARELIENLELFRAAILVITNVRNVHPHVPTEIYAFASESEFRMFGHRDDTAGYFRPTLRIHYMVLSAGASSAQARTILYHEYTHFLLQNEGFAHYPLWFEEGFAELLSSIDVRGATVRIGVPPAARVDWLQHGSPLSYSRVVGTRSYDDWSADDLQMFYAQSWLLVHHLTLGSGRDFSARLGRYVERLEQRAGEEQAFSDAFGIEVADLGSRLKQYQTKIPTFGLPRARLAAELAATVRAVPRDEIHTRLGWLALASEKPDLARRHFALASAANPTNARAIAGTADTHKFRREWDAAEAGYRRSLELAPEDWQNYLELAEYFVDRASLDEDRRAERLAEARAHLSRAIELAPEIPEGHAILGIAQAMGGDLEDGIASLERALALLPSHSAIEYPLAQIHHRAGNRDRAIALLRRVVYRPHGGGDREAAALLDELEGRPRPK